MAPRIKSKYTTFPFGHIRHLLRKARKGEARVASTMVANHDSAIFDLGGRIIDSTVEMSGWNGHLDCLFEKSSCGNGSEIRIRDAFGSHWVKSRPFK